MSTKKATFGIFLACSSAIATGAFGMFLNYLYEFEMSDMFITVFTPLFPGIAFLIYTLIKNPKALVLKKKLYYFTVIIGSGVILFPLYNYAYVQVFTYLPMAIASLFHFMNAVVLIVFMRVIFKHKITKDKIICSVLAIIGLMLVLNIFTDISAGGITALGLFWGVAVAVALAASYTLDFFHVQIDIHPLALQTYICLFTAFTYFISYSPVEFVNDFTLSLQNHGFMVIVVLVGYGLAILVSYGAITASYRYIDAAKGSLAFVLEPSTAALLGFILFKEALSISQIIGIVIAICAIVYMQYSEAKADELSEDAGTQQ